MGAYHRTLFGSCPIMLDDYFSNQFFYIEIRLYQLNSYQGNLELGACFCIFELSTGSSSELALCSPSISQGIMPDLTQVCKQSINELTNEIGKIDPNKVVDVGGYRLDADGNYRHKTVPKAKSELHLSEVIEEVCTKMDNYVRALWKSNGTLTLFSMLTESGAMNPIFDEVNIIQDEDLNKSLKYYCEGIMEEYEEYIIKLYQEDVLDKTTQFCFKETGLCFITNSVNDEL
ncbi:hypothetical protein NQ317_011834 [Molorchus minor]|uniref:DUF3456 domain-containing protein n=1 Tax=Molorchus minor TaxID=1323400 RepID=A0ABQ9IZC2_9CUCU|nr:hypothetical protein NQ317_011834 [Molorchus minor]